MLIEGKSGCLNLNSPELTVSTILQFTKKTNLLIFSVKLPFQPLRILQNSMQAIMHTRTNLKI